MSETDLEQTGPARAANEEVGAGTIHIDEKQEIAPDDTLVAPNPFADVKPASPLSTQAKELTGTAEHLAARRPFTPVDAETPEVKQRLNELRPEITRLVTELRWSKAPVREVADKLIPLLNFGPITEWKSAFIPFLFEIDRAGNLVPVWLNIIERGDPHDLPPDTNLAETQQGRARRYAILMLGNYRGEKKAEAADKTLGFSRASGAAGGAPVPHNEILKVLGRLVVDPEASLYAAPALARIGTVPAIQTLIGALKDARGWAKVDIIDECLALKLPQFNEILLAGGLDRVPGLESYVAIPLYRALPLDEYLRGASHNPRLTLQAALVFGQVLKESMSPPVGEIQTLPAAFQRDLAPIAQALFDGARQRPSWEKTIALHNMGIMLGRYWAAISQGSLKDTRILEPVYACLPMMPDVERWMAGPGRESLLQALDEGDDAAVSSVAPVLGELRDPRAATPLMRRLDLFRSIESREQALTLNTLCNTLGQIGDQRAVQPLQSLVQRTIDTGRRTEKARRAENLPAGDPDIPGSIAYAAIIRTLGHLRDRSALDTVLLANHDYDPYVRTQAIEALRQLDAPGEDPRSRVVEREGLDDPREQVARTACQLAVQYRDTEAAPLLRRIIENRPTLAPAAYDALRQLGL